MARGAITGELRLPQHEVGIGVLLGASVGALCVGVLAAPLYRIGGEVALWGAMLAGMVAGAVVGVREFARQDSGQNRYFHEGAAQLMAAAMKYAHHGKPWTWGAIAELLADDPKRRPQVPVQRRDDDASRERDRERERERGRDRAREEYEARRAELLRRKEALRQRYQGTPEGGKG